MTLCSPASANSMVRLPSGVARSKAVANPVSPRPLRTLLAETSARSRMPKVTTRPARRASPCQNVANRSSALMTAVPSVSSASNSSPLPRATPSSPPKPSRWAGPALITSPTSGRASAARCAISPGWFAPISITAQRCMSSSRHSVNGTPMWLLRLPCVTRQGPSSLRIAPVISLTVVLPLLPVMPTTGPRNDRRHAFAKRDSATSVSGTTTCGNAASTRRLTSAPAASRCADVGDEVVAVESIAHQRHEQRARFHRAGIARDAAEARVRPVQHAAGDGRERLQVAPGHRSPSAAPAADGRDSMNARTSSRSLNGRVSVPTIW